MSLQTDKPAQDRNLTELSRTISDSVGKNTHLPRELAGIVIREHLRRLEHPSVGIIPEFVAVVRILVKLQHHRVHLMFQAVLEELILLYESVQDSQLASVVFTHTLLMVFPEKEKHTQRQ